MSATRQLSLDEVVGRPKTSTNVGRSRAFAREWYWNRHDKEEYECPDCERGQDRVPLFHVHHEDGDPTNNDPDNLVGLCSRCHFWRHHTGQTIKGLDVHEWQREFPAEIDSVERGSPSEIRFMGLGGAPDA